jgi:hypothetical protein
VDGSKQLALRVVSNFAPAQTSRVMLEGMRYLKGTCLLHCRCVVRLRGCVEHHLHLHNHSAPECTGRQPQTMLADCRSGVIAQSDSTLRYNTCL